MKRWTGVLLALLLLLSPGLTPRGSADGPAVLAVGEAMGRAGETVEIPVTAYNAASGNFELCYDPELLSLDGAELAPGLMGQVNPGYAPGRVRVSYARQETGEEYPVCTLGFTVLGATPREGAEIAVEALRLYDQAGELLESSGRNGLVERACVLLSIADLTVTADQAVRAELRLGGNALPSGGNFSLRYDPALLTPTGVLEQAGAVGRSLTWRLAEPGLVRVSFAGALPLSPGPLCSVVFRAVGQAGESCSLSLEEVRMYDENSRSLDTETVGGEASILLPGEQDPKLWLVGGQLLEDGSAELQVLLQGQGSVCGGQFTLLWEGETPAEILENRGCVLGEKPGELRVSFASESAYAGEEPLLTLRLTGAPEGTEVSFGSGSVTLYDESSAAIPLVDLRPCVLSARAGVTAAVDEEDLVIEAQGSGEETETHIDVTADLADVRFFSAEQVRRVTVWLAVYAEGRLTGLVSAQAELGESGIGQVTLSGDFRGEITDLSLFFLGDQFDPLCAKVERDIS